MDLLKIEQLTFTYGDEQIFRNFSLSLKEGERVAIKGPSGIGKSTLFRLILGFEKPEAGSIFFRNEPLRGDRIARLRNQTAWLPQDLNIGTGTVREVLDFPLEFIQNRDQKQTATNRTDLLESLGLNGATLDKSWTDLSTGQKQRVGIVLCLLLDKPLLLLDEPTSALDEVSKKKLAGLLFQNRRKTVLSISHDPFWLKQCDRIIDLDGHL